MGPEGAIGRLCRAVLPPSEGAAAWRAGLDLGREFGTGEERAQGDGFGEGSWRRKSAVEGAVCGGSKAASTLFSCSLLCDILIFRIIVL